MSSQPPNRSVAVPPPPPAPLPLPRATRVRNFLGWAFLISIGIHLVAGPFLGRYKPYNEQDKEVEKVSVTKKIKVVVPTPPPPTPPPTPPPKTTPPPKQQTAPPEAKKLKLNVVHTHNKAAGPAENAYVAPPVGAENGNPNGNSNNGPAGPAAAGAPAGPSQQPTATPKPACANPHVDATVTRAVEPDYPELARQQGAVGVTQVEVTLTDTGAVSDTKVYKSSGNASLDKAALNAAKQSAYAPEIDNCQKEAGTYLFRAEFTAQ